MPQEVGEWARTRAYAVALQLIDATGSRRRRGAGRASEGAAAGVTTGRDCVLRSRPVSLLLPASLFAGRLEQAKSLDELLASPPELWANLTTRTRSKV